MIVDADAPGLSQPYTYRVPDELSGAVFVGACVAVPFGGRDLVGYVVELSETAPEIAEIKDISAVIPDACGLNPPLIHLACWMSDYYLAPLAHSARAAVPEVMSATVSSAVRLLDPSKAASNSRNQRKIVELLGSLGGSADADTLRRRLRIDGFSPALRQLRSRGAVEVTRALELPKARPLIVRGLEAIDDEGIPEPDDIARRAPKQAAILRELSDSDAPVRQSEVIARVGSSTSPARALVRKGFARKVDMRLRRKPFESADFAEAKELTPTVEQAEALKMIGAGIEPGPPGTTLLFGITGSGKTEVYLRSIEKVLERGGTCISLVPEISLTTHLMDAYVSRFGDRIAILHSRLSTGERHDEWRRIENGEATVVLGPRSAVFAPVGNLGLVVVDEEHEPSYKQENSPRYNARSAAEERARIEGASVVLGSATPAIETYHRALAGGINLTTLEKRIDDRPLPEVEIIDLREEFEAGRRSIFSGRLSEAIADRLSKREQVILFVNRRGFASLILCRTCGYTAQCSNCAVSMTLHAQTRLLRCHHCNASRPAPTECPSCGGPHVRQFGVGTERVEIEAKSAFPGANVIRMDSDTVTRKGAHARLLGEFGRGEADILVGTQMVAKGLDFPNVTLVGVVSADTSLHLPDFRAAERTFQLLTQVGGRAGRGDIPGEVVIQSFSPEHYAIQAAARRDYRSFYDEEIEFRRELGYPPFARLINAVSSDPVDGYAQSRIEEFAHRVRLHLGDSAEILGPSPAPLSKLKGLYRWHVLIKDRSADGDGVRHAVAEAHAEMPAASRAGLILDVDPQSML